MSVLQSVETAEASSVGVTVVGNGAEVSGLCMSDRLIFKIYNTVAVKG